MLALLLLAADIPPPEPVAVLPPAREVRRMAAAEANQGVATDDRFIYAITNDAIGKYDRTTGFLAGRWQGDRRVFRHMNSCAMLQSQLVCAASNYPDVPMASSIEWFDPKAMRHVRTRSLGPGRGSLTWLDWKEGSWWACFANYEGKGGEPGRGSRFTTLVRYSINFIEEGAWLFPDTVLARFAPYSSSGGMWTRDGHLIVTGHDKPEAYVLAVPKAGSRLQHIATFATRTNGQAIARDHRDPSIMWSVERRTRQLVASRLPRLSNDILDPKRF
jgi:hypothetical protein